jgi:methyl-accepting chemotaxis protein
MEAARIVLSAMWLQEPGSLSSGNSTLLMIFVGMVAIAMVVQAIVVAVAAFGAMKARKRAIEIAEELRLKALPIIDKVTIVAHELHPKITVITDNIVDTTHVVRAKAADFDSTITDINKKARAQTARVDEMVSSVLDSTAHVAATAQKAVNIPVREFSGLMAGLKAAIDVMIGKSKRSGNSHEKVHYEDESIGY